MCERENLKSIKQNQNISSEFLPSLTITGTQSSIKTSEIIDQSAQIRRYKNTIQRKFQLIKKFFKVFKELKI